MGKIYWRIWLAIGGLSLVFFSHSCLADSDLISLFPLDHYSQNPTDWIKPNEADYDVPVLSPDTQKQRYDTFLNHYYGKSSPWNTDYINKILHFAAPDTIGNLEATILTLFNNQNKPADEIGYGENFRPHTAEWINQIADNVHLAQWNTLSYHANNRGIAIDNLQARSLPTDDVFFYDYKIAGEGFPFDNLQMSALWAGTPVYILGSTQDHAWLLVVTPEYIGWVKSNGIAHVDNAFIKKWEAAANKHLVAITHTATSIVDSKGKFDFLAYVGAVFPGEKNANKINILVPAADSNQQAVIKHATVSAEQATIMPLVATPHHFVTVMNTLLGRPYGWGNAYSYNDCSGEIKSFLTPFGIWLPRHSSDQVYAGKLVDMTSATPESRIAYLQEHGRRFMTIVYIGGHIIMYLGTYPNPNSSDHSGMVMTYQDVWGLSPHPATRRSVIGQSVLLPMLMQYPEDNRLVSAAGKRFFKVSYLDDVPNNLNKIEIIDLKALMNPTD